MRAMHILVGLMLENVCNEIKHKHILSDNFDVNKKKFKL